jgi:multiple sugar transport system ATP-binding protein
MAKINEASGFDRNKVALGIRPEDFYAPEFIRTEDTADLADFEGRVENLEPMGAETYLYLTTGQNPIIARVDPHVKAELDEPKKLVVNMAKSHFFAAGDMGARIA